MKIAFWITAHFHSTNALLIFKCISVLGKAKWHREQVVNQTYWAQEWKQILFISETFPLFFSVGFKIQNGLHTPF